MMKERILKGFEEILKEKSITIDIDQENPPVLKNWYEILPAYFKQITTTVEIIRKNNQIEGRFQLGDNNSTKFVTFEQFRTLLGKFCDFTTVRDLEEALNEGLSITIRNIDQINSATENELKNQLKCAHYIRNTKEETHLISVSTPTTISVAIDVDVINRIFASPNNSEKISRIQTEVRLNPNLRFFADVDIASGRDWSTLKVVDEKGNTVNLFQWK